MADITDQDFEQQVLKNDTPVLVDFWAPWCAPCRMISPVIDELSKEYSGKLKVVKVNVDENSQTPGQFGIMSIPTLMIFKNGQPIQTMVGAQGKENLKREIDSVLSSG